MPCAWSDTPQRRCCGFIVNAWTLTWAVVNASLFLGSGAVFSFEVKRAYFAAWRGSLAVVTLVLIGLCWALVLGQLLGAVGWLRTPPLVICSLGSAVAAKLAYQRFHVTRADGTDDPAPTQPALLIATVLLVLFVGAVWTARTVITVRRGIYDPDSLGYHLPFSAIFAQTGHASPIGYRYPSAPIQFFPGNDELLSALAQVLTHSFVFAAVKNLLFAGLLLVAAHALGKRFNAGLLAVSGTAIVLGLPSVAFSQAGEAMNDTLPLLALLGGLAVLAHARDRPAPYVLAFACAGMAYGSKYSAVLPAAALGVFALRLLRARATTNRLRTMGVGVLASLAVGGSWYLRNAISYGNPVPPARIALGPFQLRHVATGGARESYSVAWYLVRGEGLREFWHGLSLGLSPLFLVVVVAVLFGAVAGLRSSDVFRRGLSVVALVAGVAYLILPGSAYGRRGTPGGGFVINLHYAMPALVICMVAAAIAVGRRQLAWAVPLTGLFVVATSIRPGQRVRIWAPEIGGRWFALLLAAALAGGVVAWMSTQNPLTRWVRTAAAAPAVLACVGVLVIVRQYPRLSETDAVQRWAASVPPTRIGGWVPAAGLLYGPGARHRVVTLTRDLPNDGGPVVLESCPAWMQALRKGSFPYSAVVSNTKWQRWLDADPAFELVAQNQAPAFYRVSVYRVAGQPNIDCPGTA